MRTLIIIDHPINTPYIHLTVWSIGPDAVLPVRRRRRADRGGHRYLKAHYESRPNQGIPARPRSTAYRGGRRRVSGGLKALQQFVEAIPIDSGMAFVVISHLDPERESRLPELLQDRTLVKVTQVSAPVSVEADHVYIIPPGHDLAMEATTLSLRPRGERSEHAPVDLFFRTLAEAFGTDAVGVVLSGTGGDGTAGIRYIREAGGITVAQSPEESEYEGMPGSAIATGLVDLVLPSARIRDSWCDSGICLPRWRWPTSRPWKPAWPRSSP